MNLIQRLFTKPARVATSRISPEQAARVVANERAVAADFTAALHALDHHAPDRAQLAAANVPASTIDALYGTSFATALTNLMPLAQKHDLLNATMSKPFRDALAQSNVLLKHVLAETAGSTEWMLRHPHLEGEEAIAEAEQALEARIGSAYTSHKLAHWFTAIIWNVWWLGRLRHLLEEPHRSEADGAICWVALNLLPGLKLAASRKQQPV